MLILHITWFFKQKLTLPLNQHYPNLFLIKERRKNDNLSLKSFFLDVGTTFRHTILSNELQCLPRGDPRNLCANTRIRLLATHSNQKVMDINYKSAAFVFPCLSMKTKSEGCNHSTVESVTFVLFSSRVFSIRWQGLRIMKYKMDSRPQIVYLFERHTCKYERKPLACSFNFSPFSHLPADLSYQLKKV